MNLLLLFPEERREGERFVVEGPRAAHAYAVLAVEPNQPLRVGLLDGPRGEGRVVFSSSARLELECSFGEAPSPRPALDLVLAVPRPKTLMRLLPEITALGVDRIVLLRSWRVQKPYLSSHALAPAVIDAALHEGLMQSRRTRKPEVTIEPLFRPFVEDRLSRFCEGAERLLLHPGAPLPLATLRPRKERAVIAIGPEGGWLPFELELLAAQGFEARSLGVPPLRVETAVVVAFAQLDLLLCVRDTFL